MKNVKGKICNSIIKGTQIGVKNFFIPAIDTLIADKPEFLPAWLLVKGFYGGLFDIKQEEINEFVEYVKEHSEIFTKEIVSTKNFRDGFVITLEEYLKQRNEHKRIIIQNILLGFCSAGDKINFEMERMYDSLNKLSELQLHVIRRVYRKADLTGIDGDFEDDDYEDLKYLEYLGILRKEVAEEVITDVDTKYGGSTADSHLERREIFSLSDFGENLVEFIQES